MLLNILLVFFGGGLGAVSRYLMTTFIGHQMGSSFPLGTLAVNVLGSFLMSLISFYFLQRAMAVPEHMRLLLLVGFMGGFTTFSSFSMETVSLLQSQQLLSFGVNILGNVVLGILAVLGGMLVAGMMQ